MLKVIGVDRSSPNAREKSKELMKNFVKNKNNPPLLIFPEGTTCRQDTMMSFKPGAFMFETSVQPVLLVWSNKGCLPWTEFEPSNTLTTNSSLWLLRLRKSNNFIKYIL